MPRLDSFMLANKWTNDINPSGWFISEKLDGHRSIWDGSKLISSHGNKLAAPKWFLENLPQGQYLDGELWMGRKLFDQTSSIVRTQNRDKGWQHVMFMVIDAPAISLPFEKRLSEIKKIIKSSPRCRLIDHVKCEGFDHLYQALKNVEAAGGEGLMLRRPGSLYRSGRSNSLLKVKTFVDAEATVIGFTQGKGKYSDTFGALVCKMDSGVEFEVGSGFTDYERYHPPQIGTRITFKYQELTKSNTPRSPVYLRKRADL